MPRKKRPVTEKTKKLVAELQDDERLAAMAQLSGQLVPYNDTVQALKAIDTTAQYDRVAVAVRMAASIKKSITEEAAKILDPLNKALKAARLQRKKAIGVADSLESHARILLAEYATRKKQEQRAEAEIAAKKIAPRDPQFRADLVDVACSVDTVPEAEGVSTRSYLRGKVTSKARLIKAVADGKIPSEVLKVDQTKLNAWAKLNPEHGDKYGVQVARDEIVVVNTF